MPLNINISEGIRGQKICTQEARKNKFQMIPWLLSFKIVVDPFFLCWRYWWKLSILKKKLSLTSICSGDYLVLFYWSWPVKPKILVNNQYYFNKLNETSILVEAQWFTKFCFKENLHGAIQNIYSARIRLNLKVQLTAWGKWIKNL